MDVRQARAYGERMRERQRIIDLADHLADAGRAQEAAECIAQAKAISRELQDVGKALERDVEMIPDVRTRIVFRLHYLCGMTWEETGTAVGAKPDAVRMIASRYIDTL